MLPSKFLLVLTLVACASAMSLEARNSQPSKKSSGVDSRNIQRSGKSIDVNLVEFAIRDTIHGKCSYTDRSGRDISLIYEERNGVIKARSLDKVVIDAVSSVKECRLAATEVPKVDSLEGRSNLLEANESPLELRARFNKYDVANKENREYVSQLEPRFIKWLGSLTTGLSLSSPSAHNNFGLSWGGYSDQTQNLPGVNLFANNNNNQLTTSHGSFNPFDFLTSNNHGPWGVLNQLSANGGFFGLGGLGGLNYPFGIFGR